jgi:hypothetical protein
MKKSKITSLILVFGGLVILAVILTAGGFAYAAAQESHDTFCASCHTQPESTFFQRSTTGAAVDLASYHTTQKTGCIDCHSGVGLLGRLSAEMMGARNALKWYTGTAQQPAPLTSPISNQNCLKCHPNVTQNGYAPKQDITIPGIRFRGGREAGVGHWHQFLARWQARSATAATCVSCHGGHAEGATLQSGFMDGQKVKTECDACHRVLGEGGRD